MAAGAGPRPTWCVFRRARRPGGPRRAQWSRPTKIPVHDSSLRGGPQARRGNPYSPGKKTDSHGPFGASEWRGGRTPWPPCKRGLSPPRGGDWGIPLTENALYVVPSSVICSANATFPQEGRLCGRPHGAAPTNPNGRGIWTKTPHPSRPSAVPPSPEGEGRRGAPLKAFPFRGRCRAQRGG